MRETVRNRLWKRLAVMFLAVMLMAGSLVTASAFAAAPFPFEEITVDELLTGYASGDFTAEEVVRAYLDRIAKYEPKYNAFTVLNPNVLEEAREIDRKRKAGEKLGPLAGVPVVIKEAVDMAGFPSTMGWEPLAPEKGGITLIPAKDAPVVARLKEAGALIIGRTNIPAFSGSAKCGAKPNCSGSLTTTSRRQSTGKRRFSKNETGCQTPVRPGRCFFALRKKRSGGRNRNRPVEFVTSRSISFLNRLPGETIRIEEGAVWIDGIRLEEPYAAGRTFPGTVAMPYRIPVDSVFVMGDNREHSLDSRAFGTVPLSSIEGKVDLRIWPLSTFGFVD